MYSNFERAVNGTAVKQSIPHYEQVLEKLSLENNGYNEMQRGSNKIESKLLQSLLDNKVKLSEFALQELTEMLPVRIQKVIENFDSYTEKLMVVVAALVCAGSVMNNVTGYYHNRKSYPILFLAIVAAAASNKGAVNYSKILLKKIHKHFKELSDQALRDYQVQSKKHKNDMKNGTTTDGYPKEPPYQVVIVSGDITSAKLFEQLTHNQGIPCILIEDEMDAVVQSGSGEHGKQINRILRNIFHSASIAQQRKGNNQHFEIEEPFMSLILAGTPDQFKSLLGSYENGLSSRFTVLTFDDGPVWLSPAPCEECPNREELFDSLSEDYFQMWKYLKDRKLEVILTKDQWKVIDEFGKRELSLVYNFQHETLAAVVKRTSLMIFRMAMILTAFRVWENKETVKTATCSDEDFEIAFKLIQHAYLCGLEFFQSFQGSGAISSNASARERLFHMLPDSFSRVEVLYHAKVLRIGNRSADSYIKDFIVGGMLEKIAHGQFKKTILASSIKKVDQDCS